MSKIDDKYSLEEIFPIENRLIFLIGKPQSGKTTFCINLVKKLSEHRNIYLFIKDKEEWGSSIHPNINFLEVNPIFNETSFKENSIIIFDDYTHQNSSKYIQNFLDFINFNLSHLKITLIINIQTYFKNKLFSIVFQNNYFLLTYCGFNKITIKNIDQNCGTNFLTNFNENFENGKQNFNIGFINLLNSYYIPCIDSLFLENINSPIKMYKENKFFYIFEVNKFDIKEENVEKNNDDILENEVFETLKIIYPKKNEKILIFSKKIFLALKNNINKNNEIIINNLGCGHFLDFIKESQNPKFNINEKTETILNFLKTNNLKIPKLLYRNRKFDEYLN